MKQLQDAYIVAATRSPIGKAPKGAFKNTRPDDLLATILQAAVAQVPSLDPALIEDAIVGCAIPEAQQGLNVARIGALLAGLPNTVGGITVNRFCASGLSAVAMAADRIRVGESDVMIAAGVESMSMVPMMGNSPSMSPSIFERDENVGIAYGMGLTAEKVATQWKVSREDQDAFSLASHQKAVAAQQAGEFKDEITPIEVVERFPDLASGQINVKTRTISLDEGPRPDTSVEGLASCGVRQQGQRDGRQQLADVRWRRRADPGFGEDPQAVQPGAAGPFRIVRGAWRAAGDHGHRSEGSDSGRAEGRWPDAGPDRLDRTERSVCRAIAGGDA
jgi:acetyl-CoA acyltransferase